MDDQQQRTYSKYLAKDRFSANEDSDITRAYAECEDTRVTRAYAKSNNGVSISDNEEESADISGLLKYGNEIEPCDELSSNITQQHALREN